MFKSSLPETVFSFEFSDFSEPVFQNEISGSDRRRLSDDGAADSTSQCLVTQVVTPKIVSHFVSQVSHVSHFETQR